MPTVIAPKDGLKWEEHFPEVVANDKAWQRLNNVLMLVAAHQTRGDVRDKKNIFWKIMSSFVETNDLGTPEESWAYTMTLHKILEIGTDSWRE